MQTLEGYLDLFLNPLQEMASKFASFLPRAAAALILLVVGLILARAVLTVIDDLAARLKLDDLTSRVGVNEQLFRLGLGKSPSHLVADLAFWGILLAFVLQAGRALDLTVVSGLLDRALDFLGSLIVSIAIAFAGLASAKGLGRVVARAAEANNIAGGAALARVVSSVVVAFTALLALEELGVQFSLTTDLVRIALASVGLAFGLALGLGGKELAAEWLRGLRKDGRL